MGKPVFAARLPAEPLLQRMRGGVDGLHIPQREGEREGCRAVRQGRERVFPDERRQQLHRIHRAGAFLRQQQGGGGAVGQNMEAAVKQLQSPGCQQGRAGRAGRFAQGEEGFGLVGVPTFILYKDGEEKGRIIGYRMKAKFFEELEAMMKENKG